MAQTESYFKSTDEWVAMKWGFDCMILMAFKSEGKKESRAKFSGEIKNFSPFLATSTKCQHCQQVI